ncbi:Non-specific serine/threonine protein kinase [Azospirillaceae bacterium]
MTVPLIADHKKDVVMTLPLIADYKKAVANAKSRFATLDITPEFDARRHPVFLAGNFAGVFKVFGKNGEPMALKCFTREMPDLEERYRAVARYAKISRLACMIDFEYLPEELFVTSSIAPSGNYPIVTMPWLSGKPLGPAIETLCNKNNRRAMAALTRAWARLCVDMLRHGVAHGDLKHDNVMITPGSKLKLIDYDSMFLPELKGMPSTLLGGVNFQHPNREARHFDATIDHFSILVILLSLRALTFEPELLGKYNNGENIILTRDDFLTPDASGLIRNLLKSPDFFVRDWTQTLIWTCRENSIQVPALKTILSAALKLTEAAEDGGLKRFFYHLNVNLESRF